MTFEPLKNKRIDVMYEDFRGVFGGLSIISDDNGEFFKFDDVKSAVEGLKKRLLEHREKLSEYMYKREYDEGYKDGCLDTYTVCLKLIDKWFEDVIK